MRTTSAPRRHVAAAAWPAISLLAILAAGCVPTVSPSPSAAPVDVTSSPSASRAPTSSGPEPPMTAAWARLEVDPAPPAREDHTWTVDPSTATAYLFGGRSRSTVFADLWAFDLGADGWRQLTPLGDGPGARFGHEAAWIDGLGLVAFAGQREATTFFGDLWAYDPSTNRWTELPAHGAAPEPRYGACAAVGPDGRLWISHGFTNDGRFDDTWAYNPATEEWSDVTPDGVGPVERCLHGCWWTSDGRLVLFGGQTTGTAALGDLWLLTSAGTPATAWERVEGDLPEARSLYAFAPRTSRMVLVGGQGPDGYLADVVTVDLATLAVDRPQQPPPVPDGRAGATLIEDPAAERLLLFGGRTGGSTLSDLWELDLR